MDTIRVPAIPLTVDLPGYAWSKEKSSKQPILVTATIQTNVALPGATDDLDHTVSYSDLPKVFEKVATKAWELPSLAKHLHSLVDELCKTSAPKGYSVGIRIEQPKALLHAANAGIEIADKAPQVFIDQIHITTVIGVREHERKADQVVLVDVRATPSKSWSWQMQPVEQAVIDHIKSHHPLLIETMLQSLANNLLTRFPFEQISLSLAKPAASRFGGAPQVTVTRSRSPHSPLPPLPFATPRPFHKVAYIAFGSNLGDKLANVNRALDLLHSTSSDCQVIETSFLYDSKPMYMGAQDNFLNGVVKITTSLTPEQLLRNLKRIEKDLGRNKTIDNGPREIDLDIILYDSLQLSSTTPDLIIPHRRLHEREFVLRPLADLAPNLILPHLQATPAQLLPRFQYSSELNLVLPSPLTRDSTTIMGIINLTPDSFASSPSTLSSALELAQKHMKEGAKVLDIGGMSTRPGAADVSPEEEKARVLPFLRELRGTEWGKEVVVSVDTFRAEVAEAALEAGANWINDVHAGTDEGMFELARKTGVPIVLMHSRGEAGSNNEYAGDVVDIAQRELGARVEAALQAGVKRWQIIIDPGIGFAKDAKSNWELIRRLGEWRNGGKLAGYPVLFGPSRKRFLGTLLDQSDPAERDGATAATLVEAIRAGCEVVRVHDTRSANDAVKVADVMYKGR